MLVGVGFVGFVGCWFLLVVDDRLLVCTSLIPLQLNIPKKKNSEYTGQRNN